MPLMPLGSRDLHTSRSNAQRGQAMLLLVLLLVVGITGLVYYMIDPTASALRRDNQTAEMLAKAKNALIGYAASSTTRPGQLPCPDLITNTPASIPPNIPNDGIADALVAGNCPSYIGRLPWKTLGIEDLRGAAGERLWYAASPDFTNSTPDLFDTDVKGALTVSQDKAANVITSQAVAVIFAPGPVLPGQLRDPANENNPANYLDSADGVNNAVLSSFISAQASPAFNDRLILIDTAALWTIVEKRVARDMVKLLFQYRSATGYYPWAANNFDDDSVDLRRRGGVPMEDALPTAWGSGGTPTPPNWMAQDSPNRKWGRLFYYAVADCATQGAPLPPGCSTLTVDGVSKDIVLITTGPWGTGPTGTNRPSTTLSDYVDDIENNNNNDIFQTPSSTAYARDRIYTCPGTPGIC